MRWQDEKRTVPRPVPEDPDNDILNRDEALEPDLTEAQRNRKASGEARAARDRDNMATVAHEERSAAGTVVSAWQRTLTAGRESGITRQAQATKTWPAQVKPQLKDLSQVSSRPSSLASYRRFPDTVLATYDAMWAKVSKPRWANARFGLYCGKKRVVARF
ncbi:hypothetical protein QJQ45_000525 [Haematococcus lacustris]|nr:hypothetical protein QJQ45_000525 [Haematococcus lacustris]